MKRFTTHLRYLLALVLVLLTSKTNAQTDSIILKSMDSVEVSLLTCGPGENAYSLYGHTAIRYHDLGRGQDVVINYGVFSFNQKNFYLRFIFGVPDYEMGIIESHFFIESYAETGRWVYQQNLNLTQEEKWALTQAIDVNYKPENRTYRYNYFYDNCSTRARDLIINHINGNVLYQENKNITTSYREMVHQWNENQRWARLGNDLLLGVQADSKTTRQQQQFLPDTLRRDFDNAVIVNQKGKQRKLVDSTFYIIPPAVQADQTKSPFTPTNCALVLFAVTILIGLIEWNSKRILWGFDTLLLFITGLVGIVLFVMIFSQQPTVRINLQILLLCPLSLVYLFPVIKRLRKQEIHRYIKVWCILLCIFLCLSFFQHYAEGMIIVALSLLLRYGWLMFFTKKLNKR